MPEMFDDCCFKKTFGSQTTRLNLQTIIRFG